MEFELLDYKIFKIKYLLKYTKLFFFFNGTKLQSTNWLIVEQVLKKSLKLNYHKIYNVSGNMVMYNSIFKNSLNLMVNGNTFFLTINFLEFYTTSLLLLNKLLDIHPHLIFLSTKINNKIYSNFQIQHISCTDYKKNILIFCYSIKTNLKQKFIVNLIKNLN